jgi:hypothetical protein
MTHMNLSNVSRVALVQFSREPESERFLKEIENFKRTVGKIHTNEDWYAITWKGKIYYITF